MKVEARRQYGERGWNCSHFFWLVAFLVRQVKAIRTAQRRVGELLGPSIVVLGPRWYSAPLCHTNNSVWALGFSNNSSGLRNRKRELLVHVTEKFRNRLVSFIGLFQGSKGSHHPPSLGCSSPGGFMRLRVVARKL